MRQLVMVLALGLVISGAAYAAQGVETVNGYLLDVRCATQHAGEAGFAAKHNKECLLMDKCVKSGYAVLTADNKLIKFDNKGNREALKLIKDTNKDKDWKVTVTGKVTGEKIAVSSIALQQ
jgi:hypothetical protein